MIPESSILIVWGLLRWSSLFDVGGLCCLLIAIQIHSGGRDLQLYYWEVSS
jgi:hypothetical protein